MLKSTVEEKPPCIGLYKTWFLHRIPHHKHPYAMRMWNGTRWCSIIDCEPLSLRTTNKFYWSH